ncbi:TPA: hypothetical protein MB363_001430 [Klebsiella quasipneumoniae subsp. similipneumoniae]|nr:hypothetical protein [Klebsiella quasipneumoniae subsp. similipneumoniae]
MSRFVPGGGFALPGLQNGVPAWTGSPARRSAAGELDAGSGFALPGLQSGVPARTGSPAKRSAAGMWLD